MRKCPNCTGELENSAVFCKYCYRRIKGVFLHRVIRFASIFIILLAAAIFMFTHKPEINRVIRNTRSFFNDLARSWEITRENMNAIPAIPEELDREL